MIKEKCLLTWLLTELKILAVQTTNKTKCDFPDPKIELVLDLAIKDNFWVTKLDGCSFQAPCASPRLTPMETEFFYFCHFSYLSLLFFSLFVKVCHHVMCFVP